MFRTVFLAGAAMMALAATPVSAETGAVCDATSFRVYFQHGSAALDETAQAMMVAAERNVAGCSYSELHVAVDAASPQAAARGQAIMAAADGRAWNVVRVEPRGGVQRASMNSGPEYAEITMTPEHMPVNGAPVIEPGAGV